MILLLLHECQLSCLILFPITAIAMRMTFLHFSLCACLIWSATGWIISPPCRPRPRLCSSASGEIPSLYAEQEKLLVKRGELEGELIQGAAALQANQVKGQGATGGFSASATSNKNSLQAQAQSHSAVLQRDGVVRIDNVLNKDTADTMREYIYQRRAESEHLVQTGRLQPIQRFADVLLKENRCDMPLPIGNNLVAKALNEVLLKSPVGKVMEILLTKDAVLYELSCLMSDPGSQRQVMHPDTPYKEQPVLYTCFVALQDITGNMGPTTWLPGTHSEQMHEQFNDETTKDALLKSQPAVLGLLNKGSCAIFDSRLLHCGGANTSADTSRALFYCSFKNPSVLSVGNPGSIQKQLIGRWTLDDLRQELQLHSKGKPTKRLTHFNEDQ
jgi:ectoine hydroxylase-related dioxygenase (phytanoyl-CoA dioxygenase family)